MTDSEAKRHYKTQDPVLYNGQKAYVAYVIRDYFGEGYFGGEETFYFTVAYDSGGGCFKVPSWRIHKYNKWVSITI